MPDIERRKLLCASVVLAIPGLASMLGGCRRSEGTSGDSRSENESSIDPTTENPNSNEDEQQMQIQYLEIVTPEVDALCGQYSKVHGLSFGEPDENLGGARTAKLTNGGMLGIRGPLRESETPVVRPYVLVDDIEAAVTTAAEAGAEVALPPMQLPGHGTCAIVIHGGIECGLWQL